VGGAAQAVGAPAASADEVADLRQQLREMQLLQQRAQEQTAAAQQQAGAAQQQASAVQRQARAVQRQAREQAEAAQRERAAAQGQAAAAEQQAQQARQQLAAARQQATQRALLRGRQAQQARQQLAAAQQQAAQQLQASQQQVAEVQLRALKAEGALRFRDSLCNTYPEIYFEVTAVHAIAPVAALEAGFARFEQGLPADSTAMERMRRDVFHTCPADVRPPIEAHGMRPSHCELCRGLAPMAAHDCGFFGDHSKGVYVSKHADYTTFYERNREPRPGDTGTVLLLDLITGRIQHFDQRRDGARPTVGFHCHESPNNLEFYVWDDESTAEPPRPTHRVVPRFAISWRAVRNDRANIVHDQ